MAGGTMTAEAQARIMQLAADLEVEMMSDMYRRMANSCHKKCVTTSYKESDLSKGESVCLDRCVAKYMEVHDRLGKKLTVMSTQDDQAIQKAGVQSGLG